MKTLSISDFNSCNVKEPVDICLEGDAVTKLIKKEKNHKDWLALPVDYEIYSDIAKKLQSYCYSKSIKRIFAFSPRFKNDSEIFEAEPTANDFLRIGGAFALRAYTLIPVPAIFQIISDGDYYTIFLGTEELFNSVFGFGLEEGVHRFLDGINKHSADKHEFTHLSKVLKACNEFNAISSNGIL